MKRTKNGHFFYNRSSGNVEIVIPASVESITYNFYDATLSNVSKVTVYQNNQYFASKDGILFSKDMKKLYLYPASKEGVYYHIPEEVTSINGCAFIDTYYLEYLDMSDSRITTMPYSCVWNARKLQNINLPLGLTEILQRLRFGLTFIRTLRILRQDSHRTVRMACKILP